MNATQTHNHCIDVCNGLLRGELSAVETYNQAIVRHGDKPVLAELTRIRDEHSVSASRLRQNIIEMGGKPDGSSGAWGVFAKALQGAANLFGVDSAVESLQRGEESGRDDYEKALRDEDVLPECKNMIRQELLPRVNAHITALSRLEDRV